MSRKLTNLQVRETLETFPAVFEILQYKFYRFYKLLKQPGQVSILLSELGLLYENDGLFIQQLVRFFLAGL